jgi:hypothetical protein
MKYLFLTLLVAAFGGSLVMAEAGTVKGTISANPVGAPKPIKITKDPQVCGKKIPLVDESLLVSKSGGLKNAIVEIIGAGKAKPGKVSLTQEGCHFDPHVFVIPAASDLVVNNKDGLMHNFHSFAFENDPVNFAQPGEMKTKVVKGENFEFPEIVQIKCDVHEWMMSWALVTESAYVAVTDANGNFSIPNVPPGNYKIKVWHETLGEKEQDIAVKDGATAFNFKMAK